MDFTVIGIDSTPLLTLALLLIGTYALIWCIPRVVSLFKK